MLAVAGLLLLPACDSWKADQTTDVNVIIPRIMRDWSGPKPEEAAAELFNTTSPDERRDAIAYLSTQDYGHKPPYIKAYTFLTTDPHPMVRAQAMRALGGSRSTEVTPTLLGKGKKSAGINDKDPLVRADAAGALYYCFTDEAIEPLVERLEKDTDTTVRATAARALARTNDPRAIKALIDALEARDPLVTHDAYQTLMHVTGQRLSLEPRLWREWYQQQPFSKKPAATRPAE